MSETRNQPSHEHPIPSPPLPPSLLIDSPRAAVVAGAMTNSSPLLPSSLSGGIDQTVKSSCEFNELISDAILSHLPLLLLSLWASLRQHRAS